MKNALLFLLGVYGAFLTYYAYVVTRHSNRVQEELARTQREKNKVPSISYNVLIKVKGVKKPQPYRVVASNEGDVVRQLLNRRVQPRDIVSIVQSPDDPSLLGPVPTA
jgi:hypothetical protein